MSVKNAFLLIELVVSISLFIVSMSFLCYLQFIILQTKDLAVKRLECLRSAVNILEEPRRRGEKATLDKKNSKVKLSIEYFKFGQGLDKDQFIIKSITAENKLLFKNNCKLKIFYG